MAVSQSPIQLQVNSMRLADARPVTLLIMRLDGELSMALTDSRGLARIGTVPITDGELQELAGRSVEWAERADCMASARAELFARLFPASIRSFLVQSPPRHLQLQLAEELIGIPWEQASDGQNVLGERFVVTRRILSGDELPEPRRLRTSGLGLRVQAVVDLPEVEAARLISSGAETLRAIDGISVTWVDLRTTSVAEICQSLQDFEVLHWVGHLGTRADEGGIDPTGSALLQIADQWTLPSLVVVELPCPSNETRASHVPQAIAVGCQRAGSSLVLRLVTSRLSPAFARQLYSALTEGKPLGVAVAGASRVASDGTSVFYGDGAQVPFPVAVRVNREDSHRQVTIMSYDLVGSTRMLASMGAEEYSELLAGFHQKCAEIVVRHGGVAEDARGDDGIMCYFGLPVASEGSAAQCVLAALEIQNAVRALGVETRIGITTGDVAVRDGLPHGVPVHFAARLQSIAKPGTVVVSEATRNLVRDRFDVELLDLKAQLKGIDAPGKVYRVLGERPIGNVDRTESASHLTPFVGRTCELQVLGEHWAAAAEGGVRVLAVSGDAGIGKSRLLREFRRELMSDGQSVIECRCAQDHAASAFHPVIEFLRRSLQIVETDSVDRKLGKIVAGLRKASLSEDAPALIARLFTLPFEARFGRMEHSPERLRERTLETLVSWFGQRTLQAPTCLIVEDANWSDPSSSEFLCRLIARANRLPLLVILTVRSDTELGWGLPVEVHRIELRGLDPASARALVVAASGGSRLPKDVVRALAERGDGVPLFIEESTRMAVEIGTDSDATPETFRRSVPSTIQDLLMARLDRLGSAKQVAQIGGTIGREFPLVLLAAVVEHERSSLEFETLMERLGVLTASGMLVEKGSPKNRSYYFKHALVRDAAYSSLWERDRVRLHRAIGEVIDANFPELAESQPELLAYHYTEAHHDREALAYWERAARHAASRSANYEAIDHLKRGLALLPRVAAGNDRDRAELRLLLLLAARFIATEGYGAVQVESVYRRALALSQSLGEDAALMKVQLGLEGYHFMRGDFVQAHEYASQAAAMAARGSDPVPQLQARWAVANIVMHQGDFVSAVEHMDACLKTYEELTHRPSAVQDPGVMCLCYSAWGLWEMGYPDQALQRAVRAVDLAKALRHSFSMGVAYGFRSTVHYFRGEFDDARTWAERAIEVCEDAGFVVWLAHARVMHGRVLAELGEPARGVDEMRIGYNMWAETGAVVTRPFYLAMQAEGLALARQFDEALAVVDQALQLIEEHGERYYEAEIRRLRGEFTSRSSGASASSRTVEAERWLLGAISVAGAQQLGSLELRGALSLAQLWLQSGSNEAAIRMLESAIGKVHGGDTTLDLRRARSVLQELQLSESVGPA